MKHPVVPAFIPKDLTSLERFLQSVLFAHEVQIDVVDGKFVNNVSWPYTPIGEAKEVAELVKPYTLEVDLMVANPIAAAQQWEAVGADMLVFHAESLSLGAFKNFLDSSKATVGIASSNDMSLEAYMPYVEIADYVQLMGIAEIGKQSQPFDKKVLERIVEIKKRCPEKMISVDGSVNESTIGKLAQAGATRFVAGSAIVGTDNPQRSYQSLVTLVN